MLFFTQNGFLEVLSEAQFENVFTIQATDAADLVLFAEHTPTAVMFNPKSSYKYVLYVRKEKVAELLDFIPVLFEKEDAHLSLSKRVPLYLIEGNDPITNSPVRLIISSHEFPGMQKRIDSLVDVATFPIYKSPDDLMSEGGLRSTH